MFYYKKDGKDSINNDAVYHNEIQALCIHRDIIITQKAYEISDLVQLVFHNSIPKGFWLQ